MSNVTGLKEFNQLVQQLMQQPNGAAGRKAISAGVNVLSAVYRRVAPVNRTRKGRKANAVTIKRSVGRRFRKGTVTGSKPPVGKVGYNVAKKASKRANHAHLPILGTVSRRTKRGWNRGQVSPSLYSNIGGAVRGAAQRAIAKMREKWVAELRRVK